MINSLEIRNFRILFELKIEKLGRVNLFIGKNNTGKSTILEALTLFASKGNDINLIYQLLSERGENYYQTEIIDNIADVNIKALSSLFTDRRAGFIPNDAISLGTIRSPLSENKTSPEEFITLRFVKYTDVTISDPVSGIRMERTVIENERDDILTEYKMGLEIKTESSYSIIPLEIWRKSSARATRNFSNTVNHQFIRINNIDRKINSNLWDNITLTDKENYVIEALRVIEPKVERIAFIEEISGERTPVIKFKDLNTVFPLKSMGDGINRILTIILALVNSDNGFLLLDEFENGLHHSVQEQLWRIIFYLAQKLNVQVFATTHSEDCISGFATVLNDPENHVSGKLIRLEIKSGIIREVEFNANELKIVNDQDIEIR